MIKNSVSFGTIISHQDISFSSRSLAFGVQTKNHSTTYHQPLTDLEPVYSLYEIILTFQKLMKKLPCLLAWQDEDL